MIKKVIMVMRDMPMVLTIKGIFVMGFEKGREGCAIRMGMFMRVIGGIMRGRERGY
jgi:hypothetical protein